MKNIREALNEYPRQTAIVTTAMILLVLLFIVWRLFGVGRPTPKAKWAFYSDDDGQTLFKDVPNLVVPFDHNGKPAVMARVYTADHGSHHWVQCLVKYSDECAKRLAGSSNPTPTFEQMAAGDMPDVLLKKPGPSGTWIHMTDPKALDLIQPSGVRGAMGTGPIEQFFP